MPQSTCPVIPAETLPRTRSGAGIHCPAVEPALPLDYSAGS